MRSNSSSGRRLILIGAMLIVAALGFTGYNIWLQYEAGISSKNALDSLKEVADSATSDLISYGDDQELSSSSKETETPAYKLDPNIPMPETMIDNVPYIGILEIKKLNLELPVITETTYPYLKIAPCRFTGSAYLNNLVIGAHNYDTHFAKIDDLEKGDQVTFKDMDGNVFYYQVAFSEVINPNADELLCDGSYPLTLYSCTPGGKARVMTRCEFIQMESVLPSES